MYIHLKSKKMITTVIVLLIVLVSGLFYVQEVKNKLKYNYEVIVIDKSESQVNVLVEEKFAEIKKSIDEEKIKLEITNLYNAYSNNIINENEYYRDVKKTVVGVLPLTNEDIDVITTLKDYNLPDGEQMLSIIKLEKENSLKKMEILLNSTWKTDAERLSLKSKIEYESEKVVYLDKLYAEMKNKEKIKDYDDKKIKSEVLIINRIEKIDYYKKIKEKLSIDYKKGLINKDEYKMRIDSLDSKIDFYSK